jgi:hypothetical protein
MPTMHKIADNLNTPMADLMSFAAMAFCSQFNTRGRLLRALEKARQTFAIEGQPVQLKFELRWPDTPSGRNHVAHPERL